MDPATAALFPERRSRWRRWLSLRGRFQAFGPVLSVVHQAVALEIADVLKRHRRSRWRLWRCRCGAPTYPCGARLAALDEQLRVAARAAADWYPTYFADLGEEQTRLPRRRTLS